MNESVARNYLDDALTSFRAYKKLADKAFAQVSDDEFFATIDVESNSIAAIVKHVAGNLISRWTDFLTTDGEKPDRRRDMEFVITKGTTRAEMSDYWERGWACVCGAIEGLAAEDLAREVAIRGERHTVVEAINRSLAHSAYHVGQIVFLAKHLRASEWKSLSIPRNKSAEFNAYLAEKESEGELPQHRFDAAQEFARRVENVEK